MAKKRKKLICDCGTEMREQQTDLDGIAALAMICPKCGFTTLTKEQAMEYAKLKQLYSLIDGERKIIRIGNSFGITFPENLKKLGIGIGKKVRIKALSRRELRLSF